MVTTWKKLAGRAGMLTDNAKNAVGVDMGSRFKKSVILQKGGPFPTLLDFIIETVNPRLYDHSQSENKISQKNILDVLCNQFNFSSHSVGISVSGPQVLLKTITLPVMSEKDLQEHLALELDRYVPLDIQDVVWDVYWQKGHGLLKDGRQEYVLVVAKKEFIENQIHPFNHQRIKIQFVDVDAFALVNMVTYNYGEEGAWLIIHLGPSGILSIMIEDGKSLHIHHNSFGAEWYGELLDRVLLADEMPQEGKELGVSENLLLEQFFKEVSNRIMEILKHFSDTSDTPERTVMPEILLSGGYAMVERLPIRIADSLGFPVTLIDPFKKVGVPSAIQHDGRFQKALPLLGVAVGVALRGAGIP